MSRGNSTLLVLAIVVAVLFPDQVTSAVRSVIGASQQAKDAASSVADAAGKAKPLADKAAVLAELATVTSVPARPDVPGYDRSCKAGHACVFGPAWADIDRNGCDTRNDILAARLVNVVKRSGSRCVVISGTYPLEPYTGKTNVPWTKANASALQVDHVVPLSYAWDLGASSWPMDKRKAFANDVARNLLLVDGKSNSAKGDKPPSVWMPARKAFACEYAAQFVSVAAAYDLPLPAADIASLRHTLSSC